MQKGTTCDKCAVITADCKSLEVEQWKTTIVLEQRGRAC